MTTITLVRHGETPWNAEKRLQGTADIPLSAKGREQAEALGRRLSSLYVDQVFYSPLARAKETWQILDRVRGRGQGKPTGIEDPVWAERSHGRAEGRTRANLGDAAGPWEKDPINFGAPGGGESFRQVLARIKPALEALEGDVLVVTHGGIVRAALSLCQEWGLEKAVALKTRNTSVFELERHGSVWLASIVNDASHLD